MSQQDVPHGECTLSLTSVNGFSQALVVLGMTTEDIRVTHVFIFSVTNKKNDSGGYVSLFCCRELFKVKLNMLIGIFAHNYLKDKTEGFAGTFRLCFNSCTCVPVLHH